MFGVFFNYNMISWQNYFFPEGMGGVQNISGNSGGVAVVGGGVILMVKKWKFWGGEGGLCGISSVVAVWIFSGTILMFFI